MVFYEGLQTADPTTAALILALTPVMTSILAVFILNEPLTAKLVIGGELLLLECFCNWCWAEVCLFRRVNMDFITMLSFSLSIVLIRNWGTEKICF